MPPRRLPPSETFVDRQSNGLATQVRAEGRRSQADPWGKSAVGRLSFAGAGNATFIHGLGRTPARWAIEDVDAAATLHRVSWDERSIVIASSAACGVTIRVGSD